MIRTLGLAILVGFCCAAIAQQSQTAQQPQTRAEAIEEARRARMGQLEPDIQSKPERGLVWVKENKVIERLSVGYYGLRPSFGHMVTGSGAAFGAEYYRPDLMESNMDFRASAHVSTRAWQRYDLGWGLPSLASGLVFVETRGLYLDYPGVNFYGPGPDSHKSGRTAYSLTSGGGDVLLGIRPLPHLSIVGLGGYATFDAGPGQDSRFASTDQVYPRSATPGIDERTNFGRYGAFANYDWRNDSITPKRGGRYIAQYTQFADDSRGRFNFGRFDADLEQYFSFFNRRRIIALRAATTLTHTGNGNAVPFYLQPYIGGGRTLRGFRSFRFTDRNALVLNAEWRWEAYSGLDMALFADAGKVFPRTSQLNFHDLEISPGFGFRFNARNRTFLRLDFGFSHEGYQVWFWLNEIFLLRRPGAAWSEEVY